MQELIKNIFENQYSKTIAIIVVSIILYNLFAGIFKTGAKKANQG